MQAHQIVISTFQCTGPVGHTVLLFYASLPDLPNKLLRLLPFLVRFHAHLTHTLLLHPSLDSLPRIAHAPAADLPVLVQEFHSAVRVRPSEAQETSQRPAVAAAYQLHTKVCCVFHLVAFDHSIFDKSDVDARIWQ